MDANRGQFWPARGQRREPPHGRSRYEKAGTRESESITLSVEVGMSTPELVFSEEDLAQLEDAIKGKLEVTMASQKPVRRTDLTLVGNENPDLGNEELPADLGS
jgi:hypothetical protein